MFASSDFIVIAMAILALAFFVWYAVTGVTKNKEADEGSATGKPREARTDTRRARI